MGERREIGLYDVLSVRSLCGLGIGMILASFHIRGIVFVLIAKLKMSVRYLMVCVLRCFKYCMLISSGPKDLLFLLTAIAAVVCCVVMTTGVVMSF